MEEVDGGCGDAAVPTSRELWADVDWSGPSVRWKFMGAVVGRKELVEESGV